MGAWFSSPEDEIEALLLEVKVQRALAEGLRTGEASEAQVGMLEQELPLPVTVVSAARTLPPEHAAPNFDVAAYNRLWLDKQRDLVALSPNSRHVVLEGDHMLHLGHPTAIADFVIEHVARVRASSRERFPA